MQDKRKILYPLPEALVILLGFVWLIIALFTGNDPSRCVFIIYLVAASAFGLGLLAWFGFFLFGTVKMFRCGMCKYRARKSGERQSPSNPQFISVFAMTKADRKRMKQRANIYSNQRNMMALLALQTASIAMFVLKFGFSVTLPYPVIGASIVLFVVSFAMVLLIIIRKLVLFSWDLYDNGIIES